MKVMLIGANGQVGHSLSSILAQDCSIELTAFTRAELDLSDSSAIHATINGAAPDIVVNAAAYTAVDRAESEPGLCHAINADAPAALAEACRRREALLVHYSTDYVFDGEQAAPYHEADPTSPMNVYGRSKLQGEQAILASGARALVLRVSWVYSERSSNFFLTMWRKARQESGVRVVNDQHGAPTPAHFIAATTHELMSMSAIPAGIFHLAPSGFTTWHGFAREIFRAAGSFAPVEAIPTRDYPTPARRPVNSVLDTAKLQKALGHGFPTWEQCFARFIQASDLRRIP